MAKHTDSPGFVRLGLLALALFLPSVFFGASYVAPRFQRAFFPIPYFDFGYKYSTVTPSVPVHVKTPKELHGVYMTSWIAGTPSLRSRVMDLFGKKDVNAVVIDVKDSLGQLSFMPNDPYLKTLGSGSNRIADLDKLILELHKKHVYIIARVASFEDDFMAKKMPEWSVKHGDGSNWKNKKGDGWLDAGAEPVYKYLATIGKEAYARGFDEIQYDYIRFPTDGNMKDIVFPFALKRSKPDVLEGFYKYLHETFAGTGVKISADLFGETTQADDDMGIGQVFARAVPYFDYISPMVYPSHYANNWEGFKNPAEHPYEVISAAMKSAIVRTAASSTASTTPEKLRPWLQDFNLGADYGPDKIKAQIKAVDDLGIPGWLMWSPSNKYTSAGLPDIK